MGMRVEIQIRQTIITQFCKIEALLVNQKEKILKNLRIVVSKGFKAHQLPPVLKTRTPSSSKKTKVKLSKERRKFVQSWLNNICEHQTSRLILMFLTIKTRDSFRTGTTANTGALRLAEALMLGCMLSRII